METHQVMTVSFNFQAKKKALFGKRTEHFFAQRAHTGFMSAKTDTCFDSAEKIAEVRDHLDFLLSLVLIRELGNMSEVCNIKVGIDLEGVLEEARLGYEYR